MSPTGGSKVVDNPVQLHDKASQLAFKLYLFTIFSCLGKYIDGKHIKLKYVLDALVTTLPCTFDLRKYPFTKQVCVLNAFFGSPAKLPSIKIRLNGNDEDEKMKASFSFETRELGEFYLTNETLHKGSFKGSVVFLLELEGLYGFHVLNSFTPSALMFLVSYSTLFFPIHDFNERIMVSLTSLLVLTALFTQASNTSVRTSYFKYLDIWYVTMITFNFLIVICNVILHCVWTSTTRRKWHVIKDMKNSVHDSTNAKKLRSKTADTCCFFAKIMFAALFILFFATFFIAAKGLL